MQEMQGEFWI